MHTTRTRPVPCPHCTYEMDAVSNMEGHHGPKPGDWAVCLCCAGPLVFDADLRQVLPAPGAYDALSLTEPELHVTLERYRAAVREQRKRHPIVPSRRRTINRD